MLHSRNMKHNLNLIYQRVLQLVQTFCKNFHNLTFEELETKDIQAAYIKNDLKFENQIKKGNVTLNNERYLPFCWKIKQPSNQETFQRRFNVAFRLIWRRDVAERYINVEATLWTSTFKFRTLSTVESTLFQLCISTLIWTKLSFST